jgi:4-hydroxy-3-polyprenylbenzoate decarboxylase
MKRIVVAITGASGAAYAARMIRLLITLGVETHLIVSPLGQRLLHDELGMEGVDLETLSRPLDSLPSITPGALILHPYRDVGAPIASGSFKHDGMIVIPCSSNTLSAIAHGGSDNLIHRAAAVTLKERRRLVLVHRETPLSLIDIKNMELATLAGAIIMPASPGFYMNPKSIDDLIDFIAGRALDLLAIEHTMPIRWGSSK